MITFADLKIGEYREVFVPGIDLPCVMLRNRNYNLVLLHDDAKIDKTFADFYYINEYNFEELPNVDNDPNYTNYTRYLSGHKYFSTVDIMKEFQFNFDNFLFINKLFGWKQFNYSYHTEVFITLLDSLFKTNLADLYIKNNDNTLEFSLPAFQIKGRVGTELADCGFGALHSFIDQTNTAYLFHPFPPIIYKIITLFHVEMILSGRGYCIFSTPQVWEHMHHVSLLVKIAQENNSSFGIYNVNQDDHLRSDFPHGKGARNRSFNIITHQALLNFYKKHGEELLTEIKHLSQ